MNTPKTPAEIARHVEQTVEDAKHITGVVRYLHGLLLISIHYEKQSPTQERDKRPCTGTEGDKEIPR